MARKHFWRGRFDELKTLSFLSLERPPTQKDGMGLFKSGVRLPFKLEDLPGGGSRSRGRGTSFGVKFLGMPLGDSIFGGLPPPYCTRLGGWGNPLPPKDLKQKPGAGVAFWQRSTEKHFAQMHPSKVNITLDRCQVLEVAVLCFACWHRCRCRCVAEAHAGGCISRRGPHSADGPQQCQIEARSA